MRGVLLLCVQSTATGGVVLGCFSKDMCLLVLAGDQ